MSSDNGIYIAKFPKRTGGVEYRVTEGQAVDNLIWDGPAFGLSEDEVQLMEDCYRVLWYSNCTPYDNLADAMDEAESIERSIRSHGYWTEYGICQLNFDRHLSEMSAKEANTIIDMVFKLSRQNAPR